MTSTRGPINKDATAAPRRAGSLISRLEPSETVLVIEDEKDIATFLRAYFRASGQDVVHVDPTSPEEVAEAVAAHEPVCVLLDLNLRGFHGLDAYRAIRRHGATVPVVVVTADCDPETVRQAQREGVAAVVRKPFNMRVLYDLVLAQIGR